MTQQAQQTRGLGLGQAAVLGIVVWVAALGLSFSITDAAWYRGVLTGVVTGGLGGAVGFGLMLPTLGKPVQTAIAAMGLGFLARLILVAAGLLITIRSLDGEPLGFALAFFPLFFVFAALEMLVVVRHARPAGPGPAQES